MFTKKRYLKDIEFNSTMIMLSELIWFKGKLRYDKKNIKQISHKNNILKNS